MQNANHPAVSVIIPIYNVENYLAECLDSVVSQTLQDIEILCVDDGSTDSSRAIVTSYAQTYPNLRLLCQENGGASRARNTALAAARGKYVFFLDSDDYLEPNTLELLYAKAEADALDIVYFNAEPFFESPEVKEQNQNYLAFYDRKGDYSYVSTGQAMFADMRRNREFLGSMCLVFIRSDLIASNGIRLYDGIICEDNLFIFQCTMLAKRVSYLRNCFYHRRVRDNSVMTAKTSLKNVEGYLVCYSEMLAFLHDQVIEPEAMEMISDYLYYSMYRNACNTYLALPPEVQAETLTHGGVCAQHLFFLLKQSAKMEKDRNMFKAQKETLQKKLTISENAARQALAASSSRWLPRKLRGGFQCIRDHGVSYTLRLLLKKVGNKLRQTDRALCKFGFYRGLTAIPRTLLLILRTLRKQGLTVTVRLCSVLLRQKFGGKTPLVSFILPVYNVEPFLAQCLDTLVSQTMKHIEIICVDDGSTDRSLEILQHYAAQDKRIRVFTQKNQYAGAARNLGLANAQGEYVVFLDSDDFFHRGLAKIAYFTAKMKDADVVLYGAKHYHNETQKYKEAKWLLNAALAPQTQPFSPHDCGTNLYRITTPCPWTKMFRREFILSEGLQFQKLQNSNDVFFTYSALALANRIAVVDRALVYYRVGVTTSLQATKQKNPFCFVEAYSALYQKLRSIDAPEALMCSYVNVALSGCLHNLRTAKDPEAKRRIFEALKQSILTDLGITGHPDAYFYNKESRDELYRILELSFEEYLAD